MWPDPHTTGIPGATGEGRKLQTGSGRGQQGALTGSFSGEINAVPSCDNCKEINVIIHAAMATNRR